MDELKSESSKLLCGSSSKVETTTPITFVLLLSTFAAACGSIAYGFAVGYSSPAEAGIMDDLGLSLANISFFDVEGSFDGNSIKVAELLVKNGLKEAYAIRGGIRGKKGWQEIQETLLPPSVHIYPKKKDKGLQPQGNNNGVIQTNEINSQSPSAIGATQVEQIGNGPVKKSADSPSAIKCGPRSSSPYPNYPDLKPPSSPSPSKPQN